MYHTLTIHTKNNVQKIPAPPGKTLLSILQENGFTDLAAPCGGGGVCGKCLIQSAGSLVESGNDTVLRQRLACRSKITGDCEVWLTCAPSPAILTEKPSASTTMSIESASGSLGIAIDIGTTTIAAYLYDLPTGTLLNSAGALNDQRVYGADVISRINYAADSHGLNNLTATVRSQINDLTENLTNSNQQCIKKMTITGNTVMQHLFAGLSPVSIGIAPFKPISLFDTIAKSSDFSLKPPDAQIHILPAVSGYVGGDVLSGILASGAYSQHHQCLYIDIGTNGEMALGNSDGFICCATAAGPAFEGAEISCGMTAADGAIDTVKNISGKIQCTTINNAPPSGICGSGLCDAISVMLELGLIDETGRLLTKTKESAAYYLTDRVFISDADIRKVQLAKAAIAGGIQTLLAHAKLTADSIDTVFLAGGFGNYLNKHSVTAIGMIPPAFLSKIKPLGNAAGKGAALALCEPAAPQKLRHLQQHCQYLELSSSTVFMEAYIDAMGF